MSEPIILVPDWARIDQVTVTEAGVEVSVERLVVESVVSDGRTTTSAPDEWRLRPHRSGFGVVVECPLTEALEHARFLARAVKARQVADRDAQDEYERRVASIPQVDG